VIERGNGHEYLNQVLIGHRLEQIEVAFDQCVFGDDRRWMLAFGQHLQHLARDLPLPFNGLIGIGIRTNGDRLATMVGFGQFLA